jgi:hypothetical protein
MFQNRRDPEDEFSSPAVERDADTSPVSSGRRQQPANLGVMSRPDSLRAGNNDFGAVNLRAEVVSKLKRIDPVIEGERNLQAPGRTKEDGLRLGIHRHRRAAFDRLGTDLSIEE